VFKTEPISDNDDNINSPPKESAKDDNSPSKQNSTNLAETEKTLLNNIIEAKDEEIRFLTKRQQEMETELE
jgi:hypothetical protein